MRIACWSWGGRRHTGLVSADGRELTPLALTELGSHVDPDAGALPLIEHLSAGGRLPREAGPRVAVDAVTLQAPLPRPRRSLFCVGRNYRAHAKELAGTVFRQAMPRKEDELWPIVFGKLGECVVGPHDEVRLPGKAVSQQIDYESELAVVIGRGGRDIPKARAMDHVFGWTIVNDVTARDVQMRHQQWDLGTSFDTFCPMGPWIVTADELDGRDVTVKGWVTPAGGERELRQDGHTRDLIFDIATLIETCSRGITLFPGDVIATGTPAGVGMGQTPPVFLRHGDRVRVEIEGIGHIENRFVEGVS